MPDVVGAQAAVLMFCALLGVSIAHKLRTIAGGRAEDEPAVRLPIVRRKWAVPVLVAATAFESTTVFLLLAHVLIGLILTGCLMLVYSFVLLRLPGDEPCGCLGEIAPMPNKIALWRNILFAALAGMSSVVASVHDLAGGLLGEWPLGIALLSIAVVIASSRVSSHRVYTAVE